MTESVTPKSIVVGVDGSKAAIRAALWAIDEAVSRDVPLHLLYAIEPGETQPTEADDMARKLATAEMAVRQAHAAIEAAGKPVKVETEVTHESAVTSLIRASAAAAMVCMGAVGLRHFQPGRVGSTAAALAVSARCPVAIVRGGDDPRGQLPRPVVVEMDRSAHVGALLGVAVEEALLRGAALQAVTCRHAPPTGESGADVEGDRQALADLDRRLVQWKKRYPQLRVDSVAVHGGIVEYLTGHRRSVGLVIVGAYDRQRVAELVGPVGSAILQEADCSLLIVNRQHL